jgi:prophage tail gpP-like protein
MSNPTPGKQYTVQSGDTLSSIAARAYGDDKLWPKIKEANQSSLKSDDPNEVFPGEIINIPLLPEHEALRTAQVASQLSGNPKDKLTILVADIEIKALSANILKPLDTAADAWTSVIEWTPGENKQLDEALLPYQYPKAQVYIGNELVINGLVYTVAPRLDSSGLSKAITGYSFSIDAVDSTIKPPYEKNNITLEQRANALVAPLGIRAIFNSDSGGPFKRITADSEDTIFSHLSKLAFQRGMLVSSTPEGDLLFTKAGSVGSVGTISEGDAPVSGWSATFDGRKRFNVYRAIGQSPGGKAKVAIANDPKVPRPRFLTFSADDTTTGNIEMAAKWKRSKQLAEALSIPLKRDGWIAPNGEIWRNNTSLNVKSETLHVPNGFEFLIKSVNFLFDNAGKKTSLQLVPPQVYTGEEIKEEWT